MIDEPLLARTEDLKDKLGDAIDASQEDLLQAVRRAGSRFRGETANPIHLVSNETVYLDGNGSNRLLLPAAPVVGDVVVKLYGVDISGSVRVQRRAGILKLTSGLFPDDYENVEVTYSHGYAEIPGDVEDAVLEHAETLVLTRAVIAQEGGGGVQATYTPAALVGLTQKWADTVARYTLKDRS
jgi:hypothetical protein